MVCGDGSVSHGAKTTRMFDQDETPPIAGPVTHRCIACTRLRPLHDRSTACAFLTRSQTVGLALLRLLPRSACPPAMPAHGSGQLRAVLGSCPRYLPPGRSSSHSIARIFRFSSAV